jgi:hypothetical protein
MFLRGEKKITQQSESKKHSTINLLVGFIYMWFDGGFLTRMMNVTK